MCIIKEQLTESDVEWLDEETDHDGELLTQQEEGRIPIIDSLPGWLFIPRIVRVNKHVTKGSGQFFLCIFFL